MGIPFGYLPIHEAPKYLAGNDSVSQKMVMISLKEKIILGGLKLKIYVDDIELGNKKVKPNLPILKVAMNFIMSVDFDASFVSSLGWTLLNIATSNQDVWVGDITETQVDENNTSLFSENKIPVKRYERLYGLVIIEKVILDQFKHIANSGGGQGE